MNGTKLGGLLFLGGALVLMTAEASQSNAVADDDGPSPSAPQLPVRRGDFGIAPTPAAKEPETMSCPDGMVEVEGSYCPSFEQKCVKWLDPANRTRCAEFAPSGPCEGTAVPKHFCIDRFEYPNQEGMKPVVARTWEEARDACSAEGKRRCGDTEWTLACEGEERLPYPYGLARDAEACNIDRPHIEADPGSFTNPKTRDKEIARLWQGEPSGARAACESPYGVFDMTGNVDEWVENESGTPHRSGLKGGHWGPVRNRCRPMTTAHDETFSFYQIGFRCCADRDPAVSS